ncbi:MAG: histone deacetylase [Candidatus Heimdallarchaeota archaeon]|nr:histone deacetylase [Candidatus Heimdallarchaeota archaeon]
MLKVYHHRNSLLHIMGDSLESPKRVEVIQEALQNSKLNVSFIEANRANEKDILEIHTEDLYNTLVKSSLMNSVRFTVDTYTNIYTYEAAMTAVGGTIQAVKELKSHHTFALLRPPGHHATDNSAMGFCFLNNIAVATNVIRKDYKKILILDVDNHFGNGTAEIFKNDPNVLYISLHSDPDISYPGTGYAEEVGSMDGIGKIVNIPLPWQLGDADYLVAFDEIVIPIIEQFIPEVILVSLGLDGLKDDPYGNLSLSTDGYYEIGRRIGEINKKITNRHVATILEGGYKYDEMGQAVVEYFTGLLHGGEERIKPALSPKFSYALRMIKAIQRNHWIGL